MLFPIVTIAVLFIALLIALLTAGAMRKSRAILGVLSVLLWLSSFPAAFFVGWAWLERAYSENWAMYGVIFISLPVIVATGIMALAGLIVASARDIERRKPVCLSLYLLLLFLAVQIVMGIWAA